MTATAEFVDTKSSHLQYARMADGGRLMVRGTQRLFGAALTLAALGIWIGPGASWESDVMLFKLILSLTAILAGAGLMLASASPRAPEVEIDTIRREVRLVRMAQGGASMVLQRCAFADLSRAERNDNQIRLWGENGALIAEVNLVDRATLSSLVAGLRDVGKL